MSRPLRASPSGYAAAAAANPPPPPITPTAVAGPGSIVDNLLATLGTAANLGVATDYIDAQAGHSDRAAKTADAEAKFPANEQGSAAQLAGVAGIAGALAAAFGGAVQSLSQVPQQAAQVGEQAMQAGMGGLQQVGGGVADVDTLPYDPFGGDDDAETAGGGDGFEVGGTDATVPTAVLGPPAVPSPGTVPAASTTSAVPPRPAEPPTAPKVGPGAMPMMPPGGMPVSHGSPSEPKPDTKRVVAPSVRNGAPVQGRITAAPPEASKRLSGKPIAVKRGP
ncbi:hypothetical protein [Mycobacterium shimoidei]|uniref:hypothetical protein n=1 Tax=Mycobacterium shimoidei TaxID=29313 RepID=UPI0009FFCCF0|nr:hypothetical protein [Mycobacterium shimoidei]MCV7257588.1 hypothetical protein [Mycobacterium shimoidei]ORW81645.1 hypothetical protein AWC26_08440 [Mycobacterium shimoidei]